MTHRGRKVEHDRKVITLSKLIPDGIKNGFSLFGKSAQNQHRFRGDRVDNFTDRLFVEKEVDKLRDLKVVDSVNRLVEMPPIFKDAVDGPLVLANLAVVYAWTGELDLAFATLEPLKKRPSNIGYGDLKCDSLWTPLRKDPRFDNLLAELAPRD